MKKAKKSGAEIIDLGVPLSRYVVMRSVKDMTVVAHGDDLDAVMSEAKKTGIREPFIVFPHDPAKHYIY